MRRSSGFESAIGLLCHCNFLLSTIGISATLACTEDDLSQEHLQIGAVDPITVNQ